MFRQKQLEKQLFEICEELTQFEKWNGLAYVYEDNEIVGLCIGDRELIEALLDQGDEVSIDDNGKH